MLFTQLELELLIEVVKDYRVAYRSRFQQLLSPVVGNYFPPEVDAYNQQFGQLHNRLDHALHRFLHNNGERVEIEETFAPLLRTAVISARLKRATDIETRRAKAHHPDLLDNLDAELRPYDAFLWEPWFVDAKPAPAPQLADFFPIQRVEEELAQELGAAPTREYDEKFHILQAPGLFLRDLDRARKAAALRDILVAAAYLDIDKFKEFNNEKGEPWIDRHVLPKFMRHVEAHVFTRGYAYRYGGDEYAVLLHNVTEQEALDSMSRLREGLEALTYEGTRRRTTVSVGVVLVHPDCHLTGHEIEAAAARAKNFAKQKGRNRVAAYSSRLMRDENLHITDSPLV